jgi:predicted amidohydrolase YtcJ
VKQAIALLLASILSLAAVAADRDGRGDLLLLHGKVLTVDKADRVVEAIAIRANRILAVGTDAEVARLRCPGTRVIDLGGRTVIPGITDSHIHAVRGGQTYRFETHWNELTTLASALNALTAAAATRPASQWVIVGGGWHPDQFEEKRAPTSAELTRAVPDHPVIVEFQYDWAVLNQRGIDALDLGANRAGFGRRWLTCRRCSATACCISRVWVRSVQLGVARA